MSEITSPGPADPRRQTAAARNPADSVDDPSAPASDTQGNTTLTAPGTSLGAAADVPVGMRVAAAWSWRVLVIAAMVALVVYLASRVPLVTYSVMVAILVTALLAPGVARLRRAGRSRGQAAAVMFFGAILVVAVIFTFLIWAISGQFGEVLTKGQQGVDQALQWLADSPLHIDRTQIDSLIESARIWLQDNSSRLSGSAVNAAGRVVEFFAGAVLTLFIVFFLLFDGERVWNWLVRLLPRQSVATADWAAKRSWLNLVGYTRGLVLIAAIDAVGIGILLLILRVPLAIPLAILVFFGAFIPLVGALLSGAVAVLIALVDRGFVVALIVLIGIIVIQQVEGHLLHPLIMTKFVRLHPLAIAVAVATGGLLAGIAGAVLVVPYTAAIATFAGLLRRGEAQAAVAAAQPPDDAERATGEDRLAAAPMAAESGDTV